MTVRRVALGLSLLLATACQGRGAPVALPDPTPSPSAAQAPVVAPVPVRPSPTPGRALRPSPVPRRTTPRPEPTPSRTAAPVPTCPRVPDVGRATQVVLVVSSGSSATIRACQLRAGRWVSALGTAYGHVGVNGVAPAGAKREGDLRTPSGVYGLGFGFGVRADPGLVLGWRRTTSRDVWVDDPGSSLYNTWQEDPANGRWRSAEKLYLPGAYDDAQVVEYNTARVPGLGSAIFLHVDQGSGTAGCVSVTPTALLAILRWERSGAVIAIR